MLRTDGFDDFFILCLYQSILLFNYAQCASRTGLVTEKKNIGV